MHRGLQAMLRHQADRLGRVTGLLRELATLRCACPKLAGVSTQGNSLSLAFLDLAAELDFALVLQLGADAACLAGSA